MDTEPLNLLEAALKNKSEPLLEQYLRVRATVRAVVTPESGPYQWLLGEGHWNNVANLLARFIPEKVLTTLTGAEVFLLLCASVFHDLVEGPAALEGSFDPRERYRFITDPSGQWNLTDRQAQVLRRICSSLSVPGRSLSLATPEFAFVGRDAVNVHFLTALLRVTDLLDVDYTRHVPAAVQAELPPESWPSWPRLYGANVGLIDSREWRLRIDVTSTEESHQEALDQDFRAPVQAALEEVRNILLASGVAYREVTMNLVHSGLTPFASDELQAARRAVSRRQHTQPFKFLDPFGPEDEPLFFAREDDVLRVLGRVLAHRLCVLYGESGVGKTSLVQAGLRPRLVENGFLPLYARCFDAPSQSIKRAAARQLAEREELPAGWGEFSLAEALLAVQSQSGRDIVVILDQVQELFTRLGSATREEFAHDLVECLSQEGDHLSVVLVVREDFLHRLDELRPILPTILTQRHKLQRFTPDQAREAITRPLSKFRREFEELLVTHLINDLYNDGIRPVELQIVCDALWDTLEEGDRRVSLENYRLLGGAARILETYQENKLRTIRRWRQGLARAILAQMVTSLQTKALLRKEELAVELGVDEDRVAEVLEKLMEARLIRAIQEDDQPLYELRHEYQTKHILRWISEDELQAKDVQELVRREVNNWQRFQLLMDPATLELIQPHRRRLRFTPEELELLIRSAVAHEFEVAYWFGRCGELSPAQQVDLLAELLRHPAREMRQVALATLKRLDHEAIIEPLVHVLQEAADAEAREVALEALAELDGDLVRTLRHGEPEARQQAAYALGQIGSERAVRPLVEALQEDGSEQVRATAVSALEEIESERGVELLLRSLRSGAPEGQWHAAEALGQLGRREEVRERLEQMVDSRTLTPQMLYALGRAYLEARQLVQAEQVLDRLGAKFPQAREAPPVQTAKQLLAELRTRAAHGLFAWPMFRKDAAGTGFSEEDLPLPLTLKWEFRTGDLVRSSPAVVDGVVYGTSYDHKLYALEAETGRLRWAFEAGDRIRSSPCVRQDLVYFGARDGQLYAVETQTGKLRWQRELGQGLPGSPRAVGERVYVGAREGGIYALEAETGTIEWRFSTMQGDLTSSPALEGESLFIGGSDGQVYALATADGSLLWKRALGGPLTASPALARGRVFIGAPDGHFYALAQATGEVEWRAATRGPIYGSAALAHGRVFVGSRDGGLYAFDMATGEVHWRADTQGEILASPTVAGEVVFLGSHSGQLCGFQAQDGRLLWRHSTGYGIYSSAAVADGRLYLGLSYYNLCAFAGQER